MKVTDVKTFIVDCFRTNTGMIFIVMHIGEADRC